ncbi:MAG: aspartate 1-decarboxylase [Desulfovibrio sp.]|jgi:aspartate 1-decarboxylase|nr:aspartate 1-decarboxylase [Desulfovibrio sp.]
MIKVIRAKLHGLRVTGCDLNYHGCITLDPLLCRQAGIYPLEFVDIWNKNNGKHLSTYVMFGPEGSRCCVLNGAPARSFQLGDEISIRAVEYLDSPAELPSIKPRVLVFGAGNRTIESLQYAVTVNDQQGLALSISSLEE